MCPLSSPSSLIEIFTRSPISFLPVLRLVHFTGIKYFFWFIVRSSSGGLDLLGLVMDMIVPSDVSFRNSAMSGSMPFLLNVAVQPTPGSFSSSWSRSKGKYDGSWRDRGFLGSDFAIEQV